VAQECIFIDDVSKNVEAAKAVGIYGSHFETPEKLAEDRKQLGFLP